MGRISSRPATLGKYQIEIEYTITTYTCTDRSARANAVLLVIPIVAARATAFEVATVAMTVIRFSFLLSTALMQ